MINISIVLFKTNYRQVKSCIDSLNKYPIISNIYIVDNSPTDYLKILKNDYSNLEYIHNPCNPGFGAAHNIVLRRSLSENIKYHLVINADVYFNDNVLHALKNYMDNNPLCGLVMPKVLYPNGETQYLCKLVPSPFDLFVRRFLPNFIRKFYDYSFELRHTDYSRLMSVPYLSGCFMFLRVDALKFVGIFDERFFMYPEDIDLTRRIAMHYETIFNPEVSIFHELGGASRKNLRMFLIHLLNLVTYFNKWGWFIDGQRSFLNEKTKRQFIKK